MFDHGPIRLWLLLAIAAVAYAPARYLWIHIVHIAAGRREPYRSENAAFAPSSGLARNGAILIGLAALAIFIFTPAAEQFARAPLFLPLLMAVIGTWALTTVGMGFGVGEIQPFTRGYVATFQRRTQPRRFWASMLWNAAFGGMCLWIAFEMSAPAGNEACFDIHDAHSPQADIAACTRLIEAEKQPRDRAALTEARGAAYYRMDDLRRARIDYDEAIRLDGRQSSFFYNRAITLERLGDTPRAIADYGTAISLDPRNIDASRNRGLLMLRAARLDDAVRDYTRVLDRNPYDIAALVNRGIAFTRLYDRPRAERDFAVVQRIDPTNAVMLRSAALLALRDGDVALGLARLNASLESDPTDEWARAMRDQLCGEPAAGKACVPIVLLPEPKVQP